MARPSDCIAMATQQKAPIYVSQEVWDEVDDMSDVLRKMEEEGLKPDRSESESNRSRAKKSEDVESVDTLTLAPQRFISASKLAR